MGNNTCKRVTRKNCKIARDRATALIKQVRSELKDKYKFSDRLVGSGNWGTMIEDKNGKYDLDYQLLLASNSRKFKNNNLSNPTDIKNDFYNTFVSLANDEETFENSTTAITLLNETHNYSIDFVIIKILPDNNNIIRRNNKKETPQINEFTWNELPKWNCAFDRFKKLTPEQKKEVIEEKVVPRKCNEKQKNDGDETLISSTRIFIEEVNNYCDRKGIE